jgi:hypothetical protein
MWLEHSISRLRRYALPALRLSRWVRVEAAARPDFTSMLLEKGWSLLRDEGPPM